MSINSRFVLFSGFMESVRALHQLGGQPSKAAAKVLAVMGLIAADDPDPLRGLQVTNHGESRLAHAVKYDLGLGAHRLVTVQHAGLIGLAFAGDHNATDRWLEANRGLTLAVAPGGTLETVRKISAGAVPMSSPVPDLSNLRLLSRLSDADVDYLLDGMPRSAQRHAEELESISDDDSIIAVCREQKQAKLSEALLDTLLLLRGGEVEGAVRRVHLAQGLLTAIDEVADLSLVEVLDGETVRLIPVGSPEYAAWFNHFVHTGDYRQWMLFLHPDQQCWVDRDFAGTASLTGVSGSGKTAIAVMRAIRLAGQPQVSEDRPVLVITLNRSLALLIDDLINHASPPERRDRIRVTSFFEYAQERLFEFEPDKRRSYLEVTWKGQEHIDEIWREFYRCHLNDNSAQVLEPVHRTLVARSVVAETYTREEVDWIRSGFSSEEVEGYLDAARTGRHVPFEHRMRRAMLDGLAAWETKMRFVGVVDHLGLASALQRHEASLDPVFSYAVIDEAQDFGTLELRLIRKLVTEGPNDLFLCGDPVQRVHAKHRNLADAGIELPPARSHSIKRNYRNSREILALADSILVRALEACRAAGGGDPELARIEPELATRSGPAPLLLHADSLAEEIAFALRFAEEVEASQTKRFCIAIAGFSLREVQAFARKVDLPVLDGTIGFGAGKVFLSDLEQTKGYEFDTICVLNCKEGVIPDPRLPTEEQFRVASRLYVAMTRAKRELILSYSSTASSWLCNLSEPLSSDAWAAHVEKTGLLVQGAPKLLPELPEAVAEVGGLSGQEFLFTPHALGMSPERQQRLRDLVGGRTTIRGGQQVAWQNLSTALLALINTPSARRVFGNESWRYYRDMFIKAGVRPCESPLEVPFK